MLRSINRSLWLIIGAAVSWGTVGISTQLLYSFHLGNPLSIAFWRLAIATPLLLIPTLFTPGGFQPVSHRDLSIIVWMGAMQALYQTSYTAAIVYTGVTVATLIALCGAPILLAVSELLRRQRRPTLQFLLILIAAITGTILLVTSRNMGSTTHLSFVGTILACASAAGYAAFIVLGRHLPHRYSSTQINGLAFGLAAIMVAPGNLWMPIFLSYPLWGWAVLGYLGAIPTALAYGVFQIGIRTVPATIVSIVTLCEPLTAAVLAWILFQESLGIGGVSGGLLLLGSLLAIVLSPAEPVTSM